MCSKCADEAVVAFAGDDAEPIRIVVVLARGVRLTPVEESAIAAVEESVRRRYRKEGA